MSSLSVYADVVCYPTGEAGVGHSFLQTTVWQENVIKLKLRLDFDIFVILRMKLFFNMSPFTISHCYLISRCKDLLFLRLNVTKCLWEIRSGDIYLCLGISLQ